MNDKPFQANDPKQVKDKTDKAKRAQEFEDEDLRVLLAQVEFRRFLWRLMHQRCALMQSPMSTNGSLQSSSVGRQDVGRELWAMIERIDPLLIPKMMIEYHEANK